MEEFVALNMSRDEYHMLVRLLGHHTAGDALNSVYLRLCALRPNEAAIAENKGPLCTTPPEDCADLYGQRPIINVNKVTL